MDKITFITPSFAVTSALAPEDFAEASRLGFSTVLSNRPDGEQPGQLSARHEAVLAWRAGLAFRHVPVARHDGLAHAAVDAMDDALRRVEGPILAHCKTGLRSAMLWAATSARSQPVDCVLAAAAQAGFDLSHLGDELRAQPDRRYWLGQAAAVDCQEAAKLNLSLAA